MRVALLIIKACEGIAELTLGWAFQLHTTPYPQEGLSRFKRTDSHHKVSTPLPRWGSFDGSTRALAPRRRGSTPLVVVRQLRAKAGFGMQLITESLGNAPQVSFESSGFEFAVDVPVSEALEGNN